MRSLRLGEPQGQAQAPGRQQGPQSEVGPSPCGTGRVGCSRRSALRPQEAFPISFAKVLCCPQEGSSLVFTAQERKLTLFLCSHTDTAAGYDNEVILH